MTPGHHDRLDAQSRGELGPGPLRRTVALALAQNVREGNAECGRFQPVESAKK